MPTLKNKKENIKIQYFFEKLNKLQGIDFRIPSYMFLSDTLQKNMSKYEIVKMNRLL